MGRRGRKPIVERLETRRLLAQIFVDASSPGPFNGTSWATAYQDLQAALAAAVAGDVIYVANGTYRPTATLNRAISFQLKEGVRLTGGWAGYGAPSPFVQDFIVNETILSGNIGSAAVTTDNSYHVVTASGIGSSAQLDGFTVTAGRADGGTQADGSGAGMYNDAASPTIANCTLRDNFAGVPWGLGAGMANLNGSSPALSNCTFDLNEGVLGSGMYNSATSNPVLQRCTFTGNFNAISGGGIYNDGASPQIIDCTFSANHASNGGGAIYNAGSDSAAVITRCVFIGNRSQSGGAMRNNSSAHPAITDCLFRGNTAESGGAVYHRSGVTATFTRCRFIANTATTPSTSDGGGAASHVLNTTPTYRDCVFFGNTASAGVGGALLSSSSGSAPTLINCVLAGNSAKFSGGGIYMTSTSSGSIVRNCTIVGNTVFGNFGTSPGTGGGISGGGLVTNTIIWGNTAPSNSQVNGASNISYSDVQGGIAGIGNINADPLFRRLPSIGADNAWGTIDDDYGDLRVQSGASPVVDAGSNAAVPAAVTLDLGQKNRTTNIPGVRDPGNIVDMGAYELGVPVTILGGSTANQWYLRLTVDRTTLQVWFGSDTSGTPTNYVLASNGTITFDLAGGNDTLYLDLSRGPIGDVTFLGGSGIDKVAVLHTSPYERDLNVQATHLTSDGVGVVTLDSVETKALDGPPGTGVALRSLAVVDTVTLTSGKDLVLLVPSIEVTPTGRLDLTDGALLVDYAAGTPSPIGVWNAAQQKYTGLTGLLDSGRNDGSWDGGGIVTSLSIVGDSTTRTLGVNETSTVFGVSYGESLIWKGAVIDSTMVIIRYTYLGDIDLNGEINGDDYFFLDSNVMNSGVVFGYGVGDINLDGEINGDDYFWLDSQILAQGSPL